jgi:hypothetical protein
MYTLSGGAGDRTPHVIVKADVIDASQSTTSHRLVEPLRACATTPTTGIVEAMRLFSHHGTSSCGCMR